MTDFRRAIEAGLRSAAEADAAKREIEEILNGLADDVGAASHGEVTLIVSANPWEGIMNPGNSTADSLPQLIELRSASDPSRKFQIATCKIAPEGYPVVVKTFGNTLSAGDAEGLRHVFETIFERSEVGRHLLELMSNSRTTGPGDE